MPHLDTELHSLRLRLAALEEQQRTEAEREADKKAFPLKTLESIIDEKRKRIERNCYTKSNSLQIVYDREKLAFLEPIFNMLTNIQERLEALEKK